MGYGFPRIPKRTDFGPTFENKHPVVNPERQLDAATMNLVAWQVAGASRTVPRAMAFLHGPSGASGPVLGYHAESWNTYTTGFATGSTGMPAPLSATRVATGNYRLTYRTSVLDEAGATGTFTPRFAMAMPQGATGVVGASTSVTGAHVLVRTTRGDGSGVDCNLLVPVW